MAIISEAGGMRLRDGGTDFLLETKKLTDRLALPERDMETGLQDLAAGKFAD